MGFTKFSERVPDFLERLQVSESFQKDLEYNTFFCVMDIWNQRNKTILEEASPDSDNIVDLVKVKTVIWGSLKDWNPICRGIFCLGRRVYWNYFEIN